MERAWKEDRVKKSEIDGGWRRGKQGGRETKVEYNEKLIFYLEMMTVGE